MKIIFAGTPVFAAVALEALLASSHDVLAVYTQPDRPAGRGLKLTPSAVKIVAAKNDLPILQPLTLKSLEEQEKLKAWQADIMVVAAYGMLLPKAVLSLPTLGCINIHPSLLPRWRGAAPIQRALQAGDAVTGVSIMQMDEGLDTGPVLLQKPYQMQGDETSATLQDKLASLGAEALLEALALLASKRLLAQPQEAVTATYAPKLTKQEALIDWSKKAADLAHEIRAFNPWPVAYTMWQQKPLRIWLAKASATTHLLYTPITPGLIVSANPECLEISTGAGKLSLLQLQLPGEKVRSVQDFYQTYQKLLKVGEPFK
jgi:methionyl-tRNA formyltransferase